MISRFGDSVPFPARREWASQRRTPAPTAPGESRLLRARVPGGPPLARIPLRAERETPVGRLGVPPWAWPQRLRGLSARNNRRT